MKFFRSSKAGWRELFIALKTWRENPFAPLFSRAIWGRRPLIKMLIGVPALCLLLLALHIQLSRVLLTAYMQVAKPGFLSVNLYFLVIQVYSMFFAALFSVPVWYAAFLSFRLRQFQRSPVYQVHLALVPDSACWIRQSILLQLFVPAIFAALCSTLAMNAYKYLYYFIFYPVMQSFFTFEQFYFNWLVEQLREFSASEYRLLIPADVLLKLDSFALNFFLTLLCYYFFEQAAKIRDYSKHLVCFLFIFAGFYFLQNFSNFFTVRNATIFGIIFENFYFCFVIKIIIYSTCLVFLLPLSGLLLDKLSGQSGRTAKI